MIKNSTAVAIFVKTPNVSPLKTRLAKTIGKENSLEFYHLAIEVCTELFGSMTDDSIQNAIKPYWAVAEPCALKGPYWQDFTAILQASGGLGNRMHSIQRKLLQSHQKTILIGADTPQLHLGILENAIDLLDQFEIVFGKASDGGFYLLGSRKEIPEEIFSNVGYSQSDTRIQLQNLLKSFKVSTSLPILTDIDEESHLKTLATDLKNLKNPLKSQRNLYSWLVERSFI